MNLAPILEQAVEIAESASRLALSHFRQAILIEMKENGTPVTIADKKTEEKIRAELEAVFPKHSILGEELGEVGADPDFVWTIDPIDGTRSFIRGIPLWGTLLGLLVKGEPAVGVVVLPAIGETYFAAKGQGAFCNGTQIHVSAARVLESAIVGCGDLSCFESAGKSEYHQALTKNAELVRGYTDCFGHAMVARGALDAMVDPLVSIWDVAPIACLVKEAGGEYYAFNGESTVREKSFLSSTPGLKKPLLAL